MRRREERQQLSVAEAYRKTVNRARQLAEQQGLSLSEYVWEAVRQRVKREGGE